MFASGFVLATLTAATPSSSCGAPAWPEWCPTLPLRFEENVGQAGAHVQFIARTGHGTWFFLADGLVLAPRAAESVAEPIRMRFAGAEGSPRIEGHDLQPGRTSYLRGPDPSRWRREIRAFGRVQYAQVWPGIDLVFYGSDDRLVEFDVVVGPGADPASARFAFDGVGSATILEDGRVTLQSAAGELTMQLPEIWQEAGDERLPLAGRFVVEDGVSGPEVRVAVDGRNPTLALVIDPSFAFSTYFPGANGTVDVAVDDDGYVLITGWTNSQNLPLVNAFDDSLGVTGDTDVFVSKFTPDGSSLVYSTYLGGVGHDGANVGGGIVVDSAGCALVVGEAAHGFPTTPGAPQTTFGGGQFDGFATKLSPDGSLLWSTYLGGTTADRCLGVAVDDEGSAYIAGWTSGGGFVTTPGCFQPAPAGGDDLFVVKLTSTGGREYSTYVGGSSNDGAGGIAVVGREAYVCGWSPSDNFPVSPFAPQPTRQGSVDCVAFKLNEEGSQLLWSTYLGGTQLEFAYGIAADVDGTAYVTGRTDSQFFPTTPGAFQETHPAGTNATSPFVTKITADGDSLAYSTFLGASDGPAMGYDIAVRNGEAVVTGEISAQAFPLVDPLVGYPIPPDPGHAFVARLAGDGASLVFSTYLGGGNMEVGVDGRGGLEVDDQGMIYVTGNTNSEDFPTTPGAFLETEPAAPPYSFVTKIDPSTSTSARPGPPAAAAPFRISADPAPFRSSVRLSFPLSAAGSARVDIFDVRGRRMRLFEREGLAAGTAMIEWDGRDRAGRPLPAGVYLVRVFTADGTATTRVTRIH